ncbi:hypothetical protein Mbo2_094 [Rhodococcus phage Mbo2]|uniref:Uncharacterized protein n=1 Tax=Rhodococcus phage Mbo2 TaxID=2936911 RepID=A0A9E7IEI2_9CAUD|nr:hypothetical protein Mbo2_094 [Rhodococcus phage Mbo2]
MPPGTRAPWSLDARPIGHASSLAAVPHRAFGPPRPGPRPRRRAPRLSPAPAPRAPAHPRARMKSHFSKLMGLFDFSKISRPSRKITHLWLFSQVKDSSQVANICG